MVGQWTQRMERAVAILALVIGAFSYGWSRCQAMVDDSHSCCKKPVIAITCCSNPSQDLTSVYSQKDVSQKFSVQAPSLLLVFPLSAFRVITGTQAEATHLNNPLFLPDQPAYIVYRAFLG